MNIFFDTNLFVYSVSHAPEDAPKKAAAERLIAETDFGLSLQVVQEFVNTCLSKGRLGTTSESIAATVEFLLSFPCASTTPYTIRMAIRVQKQFQIRYWDAAIVAAALELGSHTIYSEDLSHGQDYGGVRVINPFRATA